MTTVREALAAAIAELTGCGVPDAARDARLMLAHALTVAPDRLILMDQDEIASRDAETYDRMVGERCVFRPVAKIIGRRSFWAMDFHVDDRVLDPRPETETLVAAALEGPEPERILDLGTGSGCILLSLLSEWGRAWGLGTDIDGRCLAVARENAGRLGLERQCSFVERDWCDRITGRFDLIVSNPPYIAGGEIMGLSEDVRSWEPRHALTPGRTGLEAYLKIAAGVPALLAPGGRLLVEIGPTQAAAVSGLFAAAGLTGIGVLPDLDGRDRVVRGFAPE